MCGVFASGVMRTFHIFYLFKKTKWRKWKPESGAGEKFSSKLTFYRVLGL
jgi:hypothetical protein